MASPDFCEISTILDTEVGTILSPGYPEPYIDYLDCNYELILPANSSILLQALEFDVEYEMDCIYDWLKVSLNSNRNQTRMVALVNWLQMEDMYSHTDGLNWSKLCLIVTAVFLVEGLIRALDDDNTLLFLHRCRSCRMISLRRTRMILAR